MLNIPSLERRWLKYKLKQSLPYIAFAITALILCVTIIIILKADTAISTQSVKELATIKTPPIYESPMLLEPSMQFVQSLPAPVPDTVPSNPIKIIPEIVAPKKSVSKIPISQTKPLLASPSIIPIVVASAKKTSTINRDTAAFDIHEIEERFQNNSNPHLGLYIARYHYDHGNYNEAYNYSLKTNAINNTIEESWLIFAKSMAKLGKTDQAKKTLQLYISQSNSDAAKSLLDSLDKGGSK
ncbi:MAG: CDC27 family protein [Pseudomonadota bacterium]